MTRTVLNGRSRPGRVSKDAAVKEGSRRVGLGGRCCGDDRLPVESIITGPILQETPLVGLLRRCAPERCSMLVCAIKKM